MVAERCGRDHLIKAVLEAAPNSKGGSLRSATCDRRRYDQRVQPAVQAGDFLKDPLPVCDAYLLMHVIHDWDDRDSLSRT
jgi:hypothetical protein